MNEWRPVSATASGPTILGFRLRHLTLGHLELLHELGVDIAGTWRLPDVLTIAFVLAQPANDSRADLGRWWIKPLFWFIGLRFRRADLGKHAAALSDWIAEQFDGPRAGARKGKTVGALTAPFHLALTATLMSRFHFSWSDALSVPIKTAQQLIVADAEARGEVELDHPSTSRFVAWCKAADDAVRRGVN